MPVKKPAGSKRATRGDKASPIKRAIILEKPKHPERASSQEKTNMQERSHEQEKPIELKRLDGLVPLVDATLAIEKVRVQAQVRLSHLKRNKKKSPDTDELFQRISALEKWVDDKIATHLKAHPAYPWFSKVKGIGNENIAKVVGLIDIEKAQTISGLWAFSGMAPGRDKREKGKKLPYNSQLRTMLFRLGTSLLRAKGKYYDKYLEYKDFYEKRCERDSIQIIPAAQLPTKDGKKYEPEGKISEGHIHMMAFRKMLKLFLSGLWITWREGLGLPTRPPYLDECVWCTECNTPTHIHTLKKIGKDKYVCPKCSAKFTGKVAKGSLEDPWGMTDK